MPTHDEVHFDEYPPQTQAKHRILEQYLPAYLTALKSSVSGFHYIDAFAGRGRYKGKYPGSPLLALDKIAKAGVVERTSVSLVEERKDSSMSFPKKSVAAQLRALYMILQ